MRYKVKCPLCSKINQNVDLLGNRGWITCFHCGFYFGIPPLCTSRVPTHKDSSVKARDDTLVGG